MDQPSFAALADCFEVRALVQGKFEANQTWRQGLQRSSSRGVEASRRVTGFQMLTFHAGLAEGSALTRL
jgi:hypothetical protein